MPATARQFRITEEDLDNAGGGAYAELEVPGDFPVRLDDVLDYDKRDQGKSYGWIFRYMAETPSGKEVKFDTYLSFGDNARWKLIQVLEAHGYTVEDGIIDVDPNEFIGDELMGHIDFPRNDDGIPTSDFRELQEVFPPSSTPAFADGGDEVANEGTEEASVGDDEPAIL